MPLVVASVVAQRALGQATPLGSDAPGLVGQRCRQRAETLATGKPTPRAWKTDWKSVGEALKTHGIAAVWG